MSDTDRMTDEARRLVCKVNKETWHRCTGFRVMIEATHGSVIDEVVGHFESLGWRIRLDRPFILNPKVLQAILYFQGKGVPMSVLAKEKADRELGLSGDATV